MATQPLSETAFNDIIDDILISIEDSIEELTDVTDLDIDYETSGGILTITLPNHSQIIINRQITTQQLWVAAKSGGFHLNFDNEKQQWINSIDQRDLNTLLNDCLTAQTSITINLSL